MFPDFRVEQAFYRESPGVSGYFCRCFINHAGQRDGGGVPGTRPGWRSVAGSAGSGSVSGMLGGNNYRQAYGGTAVTVRFSVTVGAGSGRTGARPRWTGSWRRRSPPRRSSSPGWQPRQRDRGPVLRSRGAGEGDRPGGAGAAAAAGSGHVRHRPAPGENRPSGVTSAAGIPHGSVEEGHGRGVGSVFGPVRVTRMAYRNRREPNLYPADARQVLPGDPYSLGMRSLAAFHLAGGGFGQAQEVIEARTGVTVGRAQLAGAWPRTSPPGRATSSRNACPQHGKKSSRTAT